MAGIKTASLELSTRLQELAPGWGDTYFVWRHHKPNGASVLLTRSEMEYDNERFRHSPEARRFREENDFFIAPDLDWLLSRLPSEIKDSDGRVYRLRGGKNQYYYFEYQAKDDRDIRWWNVSPFSKESGCDAACALLINLLEQKVIEV